MGPPKFSYSHDLILEVGEKREDPRRVPCYKGQNPGISPFLAQALITSSTFRGSQSCGLPMMASGLGLPLFVFLAWGLEIGPQPAVLKALGLPLRDIRY